MPRQLAARVDAKGRGKEKPVKEGIVFPTTLNYKSVGLNENAIRKIVKELGLKLPIRFKWAPGGTHRMAAHRLKEIDGTRYHSITCSVNLADKRTNNSLLHELRHAMQAEEFPTKEEWETAYKRHGRSGKRYWNNPYEVDARKYAEEMEGKVQLVN